jgi:hypothetical protein
MAKMTTPTETKTTASERRRFGTRAVVEEESARLTSPSSVQRRLCAHCATLNTLSTIHHHHYMYGSCAAPSLATEQQTNRAVASEISVIPTSHLCLSRQNGGPRFRFPVDC